MANFYLSPYMSLSVPVPTVDPGPDWAQNINASLTIIDGHTHAPGSGVQITPAAININSDLPFGNTNNATKLRSVRFNPQVSAIPASGADLGCLYESGVDLYYNDGGGNQIRITQSGSVAGASGTITGLPSGTASAAFASGTGTFIFQQSTSTGANFDVASIAIRYPGSYPTPSGNYVQLQAPSSLASGYSLTLPSQPAANDTFMTMSTAGIMATTITVDNSTIALSSNQIIVKSGGITATQIANATITATQIANTTITATQIASATITGTQIASNVALAGTGVNVGGNYVATADPSSGGRIKTMFGRLPATGSSSGTGWTSVRNFAGNYTVTFTNAFTGTPAVTITSAQDGSANYMAATFTSLPTTSGFTYQLWLNNGSFATNDAVSNWIAVGLY